MWFFTFCKRLGDVVNSFAFTQIDIPGLDYLTVLDLVIVALPIVGVMFLIKKIVPLV